MADHVLNVGNVELIAINDGFPIRSPLMPFPDTTIEQWKEFPGLLNADDQQLSRYGSLAVRSGGKLIIVDTGMQTDPGGQLLDDMKKKGVDREAVDLVVFTHLHPDHVGWNLTDGRPTFPNARYICTKTDWDYWTQPSVVENAPHIGSQVLPLNELNVLDLIEDEYKVTDELTTVPTPGHPERTHFSDLKTGSRKQNCSNEGQ